MESTGSAEVKILLDRRFLQQEDAMAPEGGAIMRSESYNWASMLDQANPTLSDLATGADELAIPLKACRDVLDKIDDGEMGDPPQFLPSLAIALVVLVDKAESIRDRLAEHLYRLSEAERTTEGSHVPNPSMKKARAASSA